MAQSLIPSNSYIIFQAYGHESILQECAFALLTLTRQHSAEELNSISVCIYTDQKDFFRSFKDCPLQLSFREMDSSLLKQWSGEMDFVHRVKIEVLKDFSANYSGQILYADTDICFQQSLREVFDNIAAGHLYMHVMEGKVHEQQNPILRKLSRFLKKKAAHIPVSIPDDITMWNAGVLGFHTKHKALLDDVLVFTDVVYKQFSKHVAEQFAFSVYFQRTTSLLTASPFILHYWNLKELRAVLASFFRFCKDKPWAELVKLSALIQPPVLMQEKVNFLENRSHWKKMGGKKYKPSIPDWGSLIQQLH